MSFQDSDPFPHAALHHSLTGVSIQRWCVNERWKRSRVCRWASPLCIWMQKITTRCSIFTAHFVPSAVHRGHTVGAVGKASGLHDLRAITQVYVSRSTYLHFPEKERAVVCSQMLQLCNKNYDIILEWWPSRFGQYCMWNLHAKNERTDWQPNCNICNLPFRQNNCDATLCILASSLQGTPVFACLGFFYSQATYTDCLCQVHMKSKAIKTSQRVGQYNI